MPEFAVISAIFAGTRRLEHPFLPGSPAMGHNHPMKEPQVRLACSGTIGYRTSLEETLQLVSGMGFQYVDLLFIVGWAHIEPAMVAAHPGLVYDRISAALEATGLRTATISTAVSIPPIDRSEEGIRRRAAQTSALVELGKKLGAGIMVIQPGGPVTSLPQDAAFEACAATLAEQVEIVRGAGVIPALELHCNSPFEKVEQGKKLLARVPGMKLVFDPSHQVYAGMETADLGWVMDNAVHIHLRDASPGNMQAEFGKGKVDLEWVLAEAGKRGYSGFIAAEYLESGDFDAVDSTLRLRKYLLERLP
jgi:sugar phosphate isomerase/epimerase